MNNKDTFKFCVLFAIAFIAFIAILSTAMVMTDDSRSNKPFTQTVEGHVFFCVPDDKIEWKCKQYS